MIPLDRAILFVTSDPVAASFSTAGTEDARGHLCVVGACDRLALKMSVQEDSVGVEDLERGS